MRMTVLSRAPVLAWTLAIWLGAELGAALLLPAVVPPSRYLDWYLTEQAEQSVQEFLAGRHLLVPDPVAGWRSAPSREVGTWVTDSLGSRSSGRPGWEDDGVLRVIGLGSSLMNGGTGVTNQETLTAYLENDSVRSLNFASMLYGVDQSLLLYRSRLTELRADVVLVGIDASPYDALKNTYLPLRWPSEVNMPFVKPRFVLDDGRLRTVEVDAATVLADRGNDDFVTWFQGVDGFAHRFERFTRYEQTPLLAWLTRGAAKVRGRVDALADPPGDVELLLTLMTEMRREVEEDGARIIFVALPPALSDGGGFPWEPDLYQTRLSGWIAAGFEVIDGRRLFEESGEALARLYGRDGRHFTAAGNRILAAGIQSVVTQGPTPGRP